MEDPTDQTKFFTAFWVQEPESSVSWQRKNVRLSKTLWESENGGRDPLMLASLLRGMSIYGHDSLGDEIAEIIVATTRRKHSKYGQAVKDRDMRLMVEVALYDDEFRIELLKTVNEIRSVGFPPFDLEERRKIEITNAVMNLYGIASDSKDASGRGSYDRLYQRATRAKKKLPKDSSEG